jgi:hypothetical protein
MTGNGHYWFRYRPIWRQRKLAVKLGRDHPSIFTLCLYEAVNHGEKALTFLSANDTTASGAMDRIEGMIASIRSKFREFNLRAAFWTASRLHPFQYKNCTINGYHKQLEGQTVYPGMRFINYTWAVPAFFIDPLVRIDDHLPELMQNWRGKG